jgi:uncharacterized protein YjbI with pentapeptide repeats
MTSEETTWKPDWPTCSTSSCMGVCVEGQRACLAHVDVQVRKTILAALQPGASLDLRGMSIPPELLAQILDPLRSGDGSPTLGEARFDRAQFSGDADFNKAKFTGFAGFHGTRFGGKALFERAQFDKASWFEEVEFGDEAWFEWAQFGGEAVFKWAHFTDPAWFRGVQFTTAARFNGVEFSLVAFFLDARFGGAALFQGAYFDEEAEFRGSQFSKNAWFREARFKEDAWFNGAEFEQAAHFDGAEFGERAVFEKARFKTARTLGPLLAMTRLALNDAIFEQPVEIEVASPGLACIGTRFTESASLRVRYAQVALDTATFTKPSTVGYAEDPFQRPNPELFENGEIEVFDERPLERALAGRSARPWLVSLRGVDVATVTVTDINLSSCLFQGAHNLDKLRIEGARPFATTPTGWKLGRVGGQGLPVWRWTNRQTLAEEHHWRASRPWPASPNGRPHPKRAGWFPPDLQPPSWWFANRPSQRVQPLRPGRVAVLYRSLRKAQEDSKNEPGAADFYYGEMEMRRLAPATLWGERVILTVYWLVSGYGLRGLRALAWLAIIILGLTALLQAIGFKQSDPPFRDALIYAIQTALSIVGSNKALTDRLSWAGESLRIALRLIGPLLLGLALLAVRNRVKR